MPSRSAADTAGCSAAVAASARSTAWRTNWWIGAGVAKAHLDLLRMHVDVDAPRIERRATARTPAGGRGAARRDTPRAAHATSTRSRTKRPLTKRYCVVGPRAAYAGRTAKPVELHVARIGVDAASHAHERVPEQCLDARAPARRLQPMQRAAVVLQRERDVGMRERDAAERLVAVRPFGRFGAQELAARGRVEIELLDRHRRAGRERGRRDGADVAAFDLDAPRMRPASLRATRAQRAIPRRSMRAPRRENRASRSPRDRSTDAIFDVACRATASARSSRSMPAPLSATRIRLMPPPATSTSICVALRIERVLEQLLQRCGRALDDLAGGDLVDQQIGQRANRAHQRASPCAQRA